MFIFSGIKELVCIPFYDEDAYEITLYNADKSLNIEPLYEIMKLF